MNKLLKKCLILGIAAGLSLQLTACGGKGDSTSQTSSNTPGFIYTAEYTSLPAGTSPDQACIAGNSLYYVSSESTETSNSIAIFSTEINKPEPQKLPFTFEENEYVNALVPAADGSLYILTNTNVFNEENPEASTQEYNLKHIKTDGTLINTISLTALLQETEDKYIQHLVLDNDQNIFFANGEKKLWVLNPEGSLLFTLELDSWINSLGVSKEGTVLLATFGQNGMELREIDMAAKDFGTTYDLSSFRTGINSITQSQESGILINTGNSVLHYDLDKKEPVTLLNWLDSDINGDEIRFFSELEDGKLFAVSSSYDSDSFSSDLILLTKTDASQVTEKTILTYGTLYVDFTMKKEIINFNKTNQKYRIQVKDYTEQDYASNIAKMNSEILAGNGPDLFDFSAGLSITALANKGLLEDLYPYLEADPELKKEDFLDNILHAFETDGKLYMVSPSFYVDSVMGKASMLGSEMGWSMQELMNFYKNLPPDTELFEYGDKNSILTYTCMNDIHQYVNWQTGTCSFNTEEFLSAMEFANTFPKEFNYDEDGPSTPSKIHSNKLVLLNVAITDVKDFQMYQAIFKEPITFIGYPTSTGNGSYIRPNTSIGINAKSKAKEGAWEFVRTFITKEFQSIGEDGRFKHNLWGFPTRKDSFETALEKSMEPQYYTDENGEKIEQANTYGYEDFEIEIKAATQEEVQAVRDLVQSVDSTTNQDQQISSIVTEEAEAYFNGAKTAKEVADIIQSRVQIYVNESR